MAWLTRRYADMPLWVWATLAVGGFVVWRLQNASANQPQPVTFSGGELDQQPDPFGQFSLPDSAGLPVTALAATSAGTSSTPNAPFVGKPNLLFGGTGLVPTTGIPPGGKLPR